MGMARRRWIHGIFSRESVVDRLDVEREKTSESRVTAHDSFTCHYLLRNQPCSQPPFFHILNALGNLVRNVHFSQPGIHYVHVYITFFLFLPYF